MKYFRKKSGLWAPCVSPGSQFTCGQGIQNLAPTSQKLIQLKTMMLYISESVLHFIQTEIANHPPERSGAILGPVGQPIITRFHFDLDEEAQTSSASYLPSPQLTSAGAAARNDRKTKV